ncbi:MAG: NAD(P)H-hydrate dehydratase [Methanocellales archaeon]
MRAYITSKQMAALDRNCEYLGVSRLQLMENAGASVANAVRRRYKQGRVVIIAGLGNNGGDGFVAARHLKGYDVKVILLGRRNEIRTPEAKKNFEVLEFCGVEIIEVEDSRELEKIGALIKNADVVIDGIFGTGIRGAIREPASTAIDLINQSKGFVIAIDIPSGLDPDSGEAEKCVDADLIVTFHKLKKGLLNIKEEKIEVADIGIPLEAELFVGPGDLRFERDPESHKGDNGRVLVIGGGTHTGAPALTALAALRTGADVVTIAAPKSVAYTIASFSPNLIVSPLSSDYLIEADVQAISSLIERHDVTIIGMGLGRGENTKRAVRAIIPLCRKVVIDADALHALDLPIPKNTSAIITPHSGEFKVISGIELPINWRERMGIVQQFSRKNNLTILLKGRMDIISDGETVKVNRTGNAAMTVGGTGDVLAGIVGALFHKFRPVEAASVGAFICGRAGDIAYEQKNYGILATDVIENIPLAKRV